MKLQLGYQGEKNARTIRLNVGWMKKKFPTVIDETALLFDHICVSAGCVGCNIAVEPEALAKFIDAEFFDIVKEK